MIIGMGEGKLNTLMEINLWGLGKKMLSCVWMGGCCIEMGMNLLGSIGEV